MNVDNKRHDDYTMLPTVLLSGIAVHVNDLFCITNEILQYRFPKQKSNRRVKKWMKNRCNYRIEQVHKMYEMQGKVFVSSKMYDKIKELPQYGG